MTFGLLDENNQARMLIGRATPKLLPEIFLMVYLLK